MKKRDPLPDSSPAWRPLLVPVVSCVALALFLRALYLVEYARDPTWTLSILDQKYNDDLARAFARGEGLPPIPFFRPPGYTSFLGWMRWLCGDATGVIRGVQALIGACTAGLVALLGGRLYGVGAAWIAGVLMAAWGPAIVMDAELLSPVLILPLNVLMLLGLVEGLRRNGDARWLAVAGLAGGLSAIVRPDLIPVAGLLTLASGVMIWKAGQPLWRVAVLAATLAIPVVPVTIRNMIVGGEPVLVAASGGVNFYIGNHVGADGRSVMIPEKTSWGGGWEDSRDLASSLAGEPLDWRSASSFFFQRGLATWRAEPGAMAGLFARKLLMVWHGLEVLNSRDDYVSRQFSRIAALLMVPGPLSLPFGLLAPLAIVAMVWGWRRGGVDRLLVVYLAGYTVVIAAFFVTGRFRLSLVPVAIVLASGLIVGLVAAWTAGDRSRVGKWLAPALLLAIPLNWPMAGAWVPGGEAQYSYLAGTALENAGRSTEAMPYLRRAIELDPGLGDAYLFLADAHRTREEYREAEQLYRQLLARNPNDGAIHGWLGEVLALQGRTREAKASLQQAVALAPGIFEARMGLAVMYIQDGESAKALEHLTAAAKLRRAPEPNLLLSLIHGSEGRWPLAETAAREAVAIAPALGRAHLALAEALIERGDRPGAASALGEAVQLGESGQRVDALGRRIGVAPQRPGATN